MKTHDTATPNFLILKEQIACHVAAKPNFLILRRVAVGNLMRRFYYGATKPNFLILEEQILCRHENPRPPFFDFRGADLFLKEWSADG